MTAKKTETTETDPKGTEIDETTTTDAAVNDPWRTGVDQTLVILADKSNMTLERVVSLESAVSELNALLAEPEPETILEGVDIEPETANVHPEVETMHQVQDMVLMLNALDQAAREQGHSLEGLLRKAFKDAFGIDA